MNKLQKPVLVLIVFFLLNSVAVAAVQREITPLEAITLAFEHNLGHSLFLWEQDLAAKREALAKQPTIDVTATPVNLRNGEWQDPSGSLTFSLPLSSEADVKGSFTLKVKQTGLDTTTTADLTVSYDLFAPPKLGGAELSREEERREQENSLVLEVLSLLLGLRQALDQEEHATQEYELLQLSLQAAEQTPGYDDLPLKREMREKSSKLAEQRAKIERQQLQLAAFLGIPAGTVFIPTVNLSELDFSFAAEEVADEWFAASFTWKKAQANLQAAQEMLNHEQKTKGWQVTAAGDIDHGLKWGVGLTATKTLYPRTIMIEELELALARAEQKAEIQKSQTAAGLDSALHKIDSARSNVSLHAEHVHEAEAEWQLRQRQLDAGLVTPLQLEEARLALMQAENTLKQGRFNLALSIVELWAGCGRELAVLIPDLLN